MQQLLDGGPVLGPGVSPEGGRYLAGGQQQVGRAGVPLPGRRLPESLGELETNTVHRPMGEELVAVLVYIVDVKPAVVGVQGGGQRW